MLLLPELAGDDQDWRLETHLNFSSHRGALGGLIVWTKRRILLPLTRWLYEYSLENFKRQERVNRMLFASSEELAIENAKLTRQLQNYRIAELQKVKAEGKPSGGEQRQNVEEQYGVENPLILPAILQTCNSAIHA